MSIFDDFFNVHSSRKKDWVMSWRVGTRCVSSCKRLIVHKVLIRKCLFPTDASLPAVTTPTNKIHKRPWRWEWSSQNIWEGGGKHKCVSVNQILNLSAFGSMSLLECWYWLPRFRSTAKRHDWPWSSCMGWAKKRSPGVNSPVGRNEWFRCVRLVEWLGFGSEGNNLGVTAAHCGVNFTVRWVLSRTLFIQPHWVKHCALVCGGLFWNLVELAMLDGAGKDGEKKVFSPVSLSKLGCQTKKNLWFLLDIWIHRSGDSEPKRFGSVFPFHWLAKSVRTPYQRVVTWLILPVVICLSQRLSHACLSINNLYGETANGSLNQLWSTWQSLTTWITVVILELIHAKIPVKGSTY